MSTRRGDAQLRTVAFDLIPDASRFARLRINQLHIGNINKSLFVDNPTATVGLRISALVALDHAGAFDLYFSSCWSSLEDTASPAFVASGNDHHLIVLLNFCALNSCHVLKSPPARVKQSS